MLRFLLPVMRMASLHRYTGPDPWPSLHDPNDIPLWDTATSAGAQYVVSHNTSDFPPLIDGRHTWQGIEYVTAIEFIEDVLGEDISTLARGPIARDSLLRSRRIR